MLRKSLYRIQFTQEKNTLSEITKNFWFQRFLLYTNENTTKFEYQKPKPADSYKITQIPKNTVLCLNIQI